ncbi:meiotic double strand break transesterase, catalytic subunit [Pseudoloma neurophilia]|uniref:DNA topoisomerase (ATP-hydrolyzing) n=1 Tax=Pseudoloma neurophilia TaxID=146866 RepID=A0A0R0LWK3_9MICR|nr:meiotic double strand break transesterase, catalytic subunit [Pseudoloma neurophilia]
MNYKMPPVLQLLRKETLRISRDIKNIQMIRKLKLFEIIHNNLKIGIRKTKREIFYSAPKLFNKQYVTDKMVDQFLKEFNLKIEDLNILPSLKGLFYGPVYFEQEDGTIFEQNRDLIPDISKIKNIKTIFNTILVIEKDSILTFIKEMYFKKNKPLPFLLVTGKGYPDYNTTHFLKKVTFSNENIKIYGLFDLDPHGLNIFKIYKKRIKNIKRIGITTTDVLKYKIKREELLNLTKRDHQLLQTLSYTDKHDKQFYDDIDFLQGLSKKMEIESLLNNDIDFELFQYLERDI